ncbi:glycerophosphoryl diester phosphodiesterase [Nitrosomonas sp. Nm84]|uniref:glycerophosphodiester phosphodiesterase n=1 Tax=Nitrosomonas sp. Nm84 TaxID=200124 RepID=UPI000D773D21|nr:glycerophosphodiester phosphodiesterase [Nitrosomonas sp. Nm84]PXW86775.1 glycerophosphoryl diester phosphodiesterase [Nitrosomonas sp. Nm84]
MPKHSHHPDNCLVFAHRGANTEAMENTRNAFDKALGYAIDGIETDVQLSRDEVAVLWHDRFLNKIGLDDKRIDDFDYHQLQALINPKSTSEVIMTLQDFLAAYRKRCRLLIEVKNRDWEPISRHELKIRQTLDLIGQNPEQRIMASSFNLASLVYAHQYKPAFPLVYNFETHQTIADARQLLNTHAFLHGLCLPIENLDHAIVDVLRDHGKCVAVYTCNSDTEINKALQLGVDILISDLPHKALMLRDQ